MFALLSGAVVLSAALLFLVEPMVARRLLPAFGGSAAVWTTCLVFYQAVLLGGYAYAAALVRLKRPAVALAIHGLLAALSLLCFPIGANLSAGHDSSLDHPVSSLLLLLAWHTGLPLLVLSSTSPLLQHWWARTGGALPYRLYAVSNLASLLALLAYPLLVEPAFPLSRQFTAWGILYGLYLLCSLASMLLLSRRRSSPEAPTEERVFRLALDWIAWFTLSACASALLIGITNHLGSNVAAVPLLWVLPLAVYLAAFSLAFAPFSLLPRPLLLRALAVALGLLAYISYDIHAVEALEVILPVTLSGLFVCCYFCMREIYLRRPSSHQLTGFYLAIAGGGAAGSLAMTLLAPQWLSGVYDLLVALLALAIAVTILLWSESQLASRAIAIVITASLAASLATTVRLYHQDTLSIRRSFYGSLRVTQSPRAGPEQIRSLYSGTIRHGAQYVQLPRRRRPITYYAPDSGIGIVLREMEGAGRHIGVVGLGVGTLAAYGKPGDRIDFFEINRQVVDMATSLFTYLRESPADVHVQLGDGRLSIASAHGPPFDVLALDAFSGDAIPVHLLTLEAMRVYQLHLQPRGVIAVHVSNNYLDLAPVVQRVAARLGFSSVLVRNHEDLEETYSTSEWILVTRDPAWLENRAVKAGQVGDQVPPSLQPWTDDRSSLLEVWKGLGVSR